MSRFLAARAPADVVRVAVAMALSLAACHHPAPPAAPAVPQTPAAYRELAAKLDALAQAAVDDQAHPIAGLAVAVYWHGDPVLVKGYGLADVEARTPMAADARFRIGSVTKQFTAAAIELLALDGKLSIDDPITRFLPDYPTQGQTITIRHLLTHTSGIKNYTDLPWFEEHQATAMPRADLVAQFAAAPLDFTPGARWAYSNSGYYLLGLIIEKASGQPYADFLRDKVLSRAHLGHTGYCAQEQTGPDDARGYEAKDGALVPADPLDMAHPYAAGALCSTAADLVAWARALAAGEVVRAATFAEMATPVTLADGTSYPYGFGLGIGELGGHRQISHGGGINGFVSWLVDFPDSDLAIAVLVNTPSPVANDLGEAISRVVLDVPVPEVLDVAVSADEAASLVGTYRFAQLDQEVPVNYDDGVLHVGPPGAPGPKLLSQGNGHYTIVELQADVTFRVVDGQAAEMIVIQHGLEFHGDRLAADAAPAPGEPAAPGAD
ncbi:MAG: beta-lactamase family protein, partial [Myxococcales bacterium]|nr:beta-lactamase family protein [Myxococcales bacterium]